jgi:transposase
MADEPAPVEIPVKELYTYKEVAEYFDVDTATVKMWVHRKQMISIPAPEGGPRKYITYEEILRWIDLMFIPNSHKEIRQAAKDMERLRKKYKRKQQKQVRYEHWKKRQQQR